MEEVKSKKRKCKESYFCKVVVLGTHLILHVVLFGIFMRFFGVPSLEKYLDMETIVISSEEQTNGIEAPAITFVALRRDMGWKSVEQNMTYETFAMFNHCQGLNAHMEDCVKNDTIERDEFLMSARLGFNEKNSTSLVDDSSSSMWSEDLTVTVMGRHFTLELATTIPPTSDAFLMFKLNSSFDYLIWLHDESFFIPSLNPLGPPGQRWNVLGARNVGLYNLNTEMEKS